MGFMAAIAPVIGAIGAVSGMVGTVMTGQAQSAMASYQAQVARNNQVLAQQNANLALQQGTQAEETQRIKTGEMIGSMEAMQGASGVELGAGSPLQVRRSAAETGELDAETIRYNAQLQARNAMYQSQMYGTQAGLYGAEANWATMSSILGGASSVSNKWLWMQQSGIFGNQPGNPATASSNPYDAGSYYGWAMNQPMSINQ